MVMKTKPLSRLVPLNCVREKGLEPSRQRHRNLNPARLPIPPLARWTAFLHRPIRYMALLPGGRP